MNEVFEKIIEKLEEAYINCFKQGDYKFNNGIDKAKEIVQEVAEEYNNGWIPASERLPEEHESMFAKLKGTDKWVLGMFEKMSDDVNVTVEFDNGKRKTITLHTNDGKWNANYRIAKFKVVAWQPLPEPYKQNGE